MPLVLNHNGLRLWHVTEPIDQLLRRARLADEQQHILEEVNSTLRKKLWLCARVIAREMFNDTIEYTADGAPFLVQGKRHISISHTADMLAFYEADKPCGVDIERCDRDAHRVARKFLDSHEVDIVKTVYPANPELLIWCAKEALYKMSGVAGAEFLHDFRIVGADVGAIKCRAFGHDVTIYYHFHDPYLITYSV